MEQDVPRGVEPVIRTTRVAVSIAVLAFLVACASPPKPVVRAPVVDRTPASAPMSSAPPAAAATTPPPGAENAGKPGYYTVKSGDTLMRIGLETGQSWRDLAAWNDLSNPNLIEVGQVLRVVPPETQESVATAAGAAKANPVAPSSAQSRPLSTANNKPAANAASDKTPVGDEVNFIWPAKGPLLESFDEARNKGVSIGGKLGEPVFAAADGRVVYAGAGLRGYGNLVILKHNNTYLTAYAHNQSLLVKEDQTVRKGQQIAEMGSSDADRVKLHFEVRRQGKPVDPLKFLPSR